MLEIDAAERVREAMDVLIGIRHLRVSTQHADARHRAVAAFDTLGMAFPPSSWEQAWVRVAVLAIRAFNVLREELHLGLSET